MAGHRHRQAAAHTHKRRRSRAPHYFYLTSKEESNTQRTVRVRHAASRAPSASASSSFSSTQESLATRIMMVCRPVPCDPASAQRLATSRCHLRPCQGTPARTSSYAHLLHQDGPAHTCNVLCALAEGAVAPLSREVTPVADVDTCSPLKQLLLQPQQLLREAGLHTHTAHHNMRW